MAGGLFSRAGRAAWRYLTLADVPTTTTFSADETPPRPVDMVIHEMMHGTGRVNRADALSVPPVLRGRNLLAAIATLPLQQLGPDRQIARLPLLEQIDPDIPNVVTLAQTVEDLLFEGVAWWRVTAFGSDGYPTSARHLDFGTVSVQPSNNGGSPAPLPSGIDPRAAQGAVVYVDGEPVPWSELIRFDSPNPGILVVAGRAIRRALLLAKASELYAGAPTPLGFFTPTESTDPADDDEITEILDGWEAQRRRRATAYVPAALTYNPVDVMSPADLQLVELHKQIALELANALGLDPEDLGVSTTSRTYQNGVDRRQDRINDVLMPYMRAVTDRLSMPDVTKRGYAVRFDLDDYLKADPATRAQVQATYLDKGVTTVDEVRAEEGLPELSPAQRVEIADRVAPAQRERPQQTVRAGVTQGETFDGGPVTDFTIDVAEQFAADEGGRTVEGIVVPFNRVTYKNGRKFRFAPGALKYAEMKRVKLLVDHDFSQAIGKLVHVEERPEGVFGRFKVAHTPEGDKALALAADEVRDGFSVGVDITETTPDPDNRGVLLVLDATWRETSLLAVPAYDDARVSRVAASADKEGTTVDPCATCGQHHDANVACAPTTPTAPVAIGADLGAQFAAFLDYQAKQAAPQPEQRPVVNPTRITAVHEASPYRFGRDGILLRGTHEFSADVFAAIKGDYTAENRVNDFIREQFDVVTTDVNELNPARQRPDMYVDQRSFNYPLWNAINKGALTEITPFTFPKFSSAGSLVANHTEGNEPSSGTFVTTSATVTPTAVSGKMKISRETYDQGGNPQVTNLIWRQMLKGWYEALEAFAVSTLDAASPTQIDFSGSPGLADDDLDQALTAAFADLQFVRGGFSMDNMFTQIDLYKALVAAKGQDGRRLYPALGPTNANGTVRARYAALDINGVVAYPAWALAATGTVAASSYLFDSDSVWGWASNPQRLDIDRTEVANVYIGLWGYKAAVITDINGVREIVYDPA